MAKAGCATAQTAESYDAAATAFDHVLHAPEDHAGQLAPELDAALARRGTSVGKVDAEFRTGLAGYSVASHPEPLSPGGAAALDL